MKQKATALTATTVAVTSLLPSINQVDTRTVAAQQLPTKNTQYIKLNSKTLHSNNEMNTRNNTNSLKKANTSFTKSTKLYTTVHAHTKDPSVQVDDQILIGQLLEHMGNTDHSFRQQHHFEKTNAVNPLPYLVR
ncbi:M23 family peptidase [Bacillus sp. Xin]|uniref:M23 family peptidase n=1 Tax=unclassified Bacillus (in: firmicutes) TaxID=185979 RepID=UPI001574EDE7|nr:M23 family peptidase [Bacillus sp. Xin]NSW39240.1 M23 family peptidase [Bacillus sp. Xin1]